MQQQILKENSRIAKAYEAKEIDERHRHKYEFNNAYYDLFDIG